MLRTNLRVLQGCEDNLCALHRGMQFSEKQDTCRVVSENLRVSLPDGTSKKKKKHIYIFIYFHKFLLTGKFLKVI